MCFTLLALVECGPCDVFFLDIIFEGFFGKDCGALSRAPRHRLRRTLLHALKVVELLLPFLQPPAKVRCKVFNSRRPKDNAGFSIHAVPKKQ